MNRGITLLGLAVLLATIGLVAFPIVVMGVEQFDVEQEVGILTLPVGLLVILLGASSPDPRVTTVSGLFGNPEENILRRTLTEPPPNVEARFRSSPRESANCRYCYTAIAPDTLECPRCGRRRECRGCGKPMFFLAGAVRCAPCIRDEAYCNCPRIKRSGTHLTSRARGS